MNDHYKDLYERCNNSATNMCVIIGYYEGVILTAASRTKDEMKQALQLGEFIWDRRDERVWSLEDARAAMLALPTEELNFSE